MVGGEWSIDVFYMATNSSNRLLVGASQAPFDVADSSACNPSFGTSDPDGMTIDIELKA